MVVVVAQTRDHSSSAQVDLARRLTGKRTNTLVRAHRDKYVALYRECLCDREAIVNRDNLAIKKTASADASGERCDAVVVAASAVTRTKTSRKRIPDKIGRASWRE